MSLPTMRGMGHSCGANAHQEYRHHDAFTARTGKERGVFALMFAALLIVLVGVGGLAVDFGMLYNRKAELHTLSRTVALAAARELNGTSDGVTAALARAAETAEDLKYNYGLRVDWNNAAITFSNSPAPDAEWISADAARAMPAGRFYARVDTAALADGIGRVDTILMPVLSSAHASVNVTERAVAGRASINVIPLAVCAMSTSAGAPRTNPGPPPTVELVEYGFRRGVGYDLMQLNPNGTTAVNFVIDPYTAPGGLGSPLNTNAASVGPYICSGRMRVPRVTGGPIRVTSPFPLGALFRHLNSRFDQFPDNLCHPNGAPPDFNIRAFAFDSTNGTSWMNPLPTTQSALRNTDDEQLRTIADLDAPQSGTVPSQYGPLWTYSRAVKFSSYVPGQPEPSRGYSKFAPTDWPSLYPTVPPPRATGYPSTTQPYDATTGNNYLRPSAVNATLSIVNRRVLHVPLLACPVTAGSNVEATVLAIGKFFMTVPATATSIHAEFAGIVPDAQLTGHVTLYP